MVIKQNLIQHEKTHNFFKLNPVSACLRAMFAGGLFMGVTVPVQAELPIASPVWVGSGSATSSVVGNTLNINQETDRAILNWERFNVSADSAVNFKQPSASSIALNRIADSNPSQILGTVSANGQIYLVNKSGFVFGKDSVVDAHGLVASTLDIDTQIFNEGGSITKVSEDTRIANLDDRAAFKGSGEFYQKNDDGSFKLDAEGKKIPIKIEIKSGAQIKSSPGGRILVLAPTILNSGHVESSGGQVVMAAATDKVYLQEAGTENKDVRGLLVEVKTGGKVENLGSITANHGNITLMGFAVNQKGKVSATTTTNLNGTIRLLAREGGTVVQKNDKPSLQATSTTRTVDKGDGLEQSAMVTLDAGSKTEILPEKEYLIEETTLVSGETINQAVEKTAIDNQAQPQSRVEIMANKVHLKSGSQIVAPSGKVTLTATANPQDPIGNSISRNNSRILIESGAQIDVSGTDNVVKSMESNVLEVELRNFDLKDAPLQKNGILKGKTVLVDAREGTPLSDIQPLIDTTKRNIDERLVKGGQINLESEGDLIVAKGAVLDFSGGAATFADGFINTSKLVSNGRLYDISKADPSLKYDAIYGEVVKKYAKWGVTKTWNIEGPFSLSRFEKGYVQGYDAGTLVTKGHNVILDGELLGHAINGRRQRTLEEQAKGGNLAVSNLLSSANTIQSPQSLIFSDTQVTSNFGLKDLFPVGSDGLAAPLAINANKLSASGIQNASFNINGKITIADKTKLKLLDGGSLSLNGSDINVLGDIEGTGSTVNLSGADISVAKGASIRLQGNWVNDFVNPANLEDISLVPLAINGGKFIATAGGEIKLEAGSLVDVSGGAWLKTNRKLVAGNAGDITLIATSPLDQTKSNVIMDGTLNAFGLEKGGRFTAGANSVVIRREELDKASIPPQTLQLSSDFFSKSGFAEYDISSKRKGLTVEEGVNLNLQQTNRELDDDYLSRANASGISEFSHEATLLPEQRAESKLTLRADHSGHTVAGTYVDSNLVIAKNAIINADDLSTVNLVSDSSLVFDGEINARGGNVGLTLLPYQGGVKGDDPRFQIKQGIWLGDTAKIDVSGTAHAIVDNLGHRSGDVFDGGNVTVDAQRGFFASKAGSSINVSGTQTLLDLPEYNQESIGVNYKPSLIGSHAGTISITSDAGIFIDGQMHAKGGDTPGTAGGKLSIALSDAKRDDPDVEVGSTFPDASKPENARVIFVSQEKTPVFSSQFMTAGDSLPNDQKHIGKGYLAASQIVEGGFSSLDIGGLGETRFQDDVTLQLDNALSLSDAKFGWESKTGASSGKVNLNATTVSITGFAPEALLPIDGGGQLTVNADLIELAGNSLTTGFNSVNFNSTGDIRLRGANLKINNAESSNNLKFAGQFKTFSKLNLTADQIYPTSLSSFTLAVSGDPSGTVSFNKGNDSQPVFSALSKLTVKAPNIEQNGTIKAPFGEIELDATDTLKFGANSITSVSAEQQTIPLGVILGGQEWLLPLGLGGVSPVLESPQKKITVKADKIFRDDGALLDLSGGGDLLAYEFIPGAGGSKDVLNTSKSFAVLPGLKGYAPFDFRETPISKLKTGDSIYLSGGSGLAEGEYALLPARYALLPGAFLVTPQSGSGDVIPGSARTRIDGSSIVSGFGKVAGTNIRDQRWSEFVIEPGSIALTRSEYKLDVASKFFADRAVNKGLALPRLTQDAGQVVFNAKSQLDLPTVIADVVKGGRGGMVDIVADNLTVVNGKTGATGVVELLAGDIDKFKIESLLLGATRSTDTASGNTKLNVKAKQVEIAEQVNITAPELLLAASDKIQLKNGSKVKADGVVADSNAGTILEVSEDGALLRVSSGKQATIKRSNPHGLKGDLLVDQGATISAGTGSVLHESTHNSTLEGELELTEGSLSLGAQAINLGEVSGLTNGLSLDNNKLNKLTLKELILTSRSNVNLYGQIAKTDVNGNPVPVELGNLVIDAAGLSGWANAEKTVLLNAKTVTFANRAGAVGSAGDGTGILNINADQLVLDKGNYQLSGFDQVNLNLKDNLIGRDEGKLTALSKVTITTPFVSSVNGANTTIDATGHQLELNQASQNVTATTQGIGAQLKLIADSIALNTSLLYKTGHVSLDALQDDVVLDSKARIDVSGAMANAGLSKPVNLAAGKITLNSEKKNVLADANSQLLLKGINANMQAGLLSAQAAKGQVQLNGLIDAHGVGNANGGRIAIDTGSLTADGFNSLNNVFTSAGFTGGVDLRLRSGDINIDATQTVTANNIKMVADTGKIIVDGSLDAQGANGGNVDLAAEDALTLNAGARILAGAQDVNGKGGRVSLSSIDENGDGAGIVFQNGARIDVAAKGNGKEGGVHLRADRLDTNSDGVDDEVNISNIASGAITGDSDVAVEAVKIYNDDNITLADQGAYHADNLNYMAKLLENNVANTRFGSNFTIMPGVEVRSPGDIVIADAWDFVTWRYDAGKSKVNAVTGGTEPVLTPGVLTLRAGKDLQINGNLSDGFAPGQLDTEFGPAVVSDYLQPGQSWSYNLVAGADLTSADKMAVVADRGDAVLSANVKVRTGTGDINIHTGRDIVYGGSTIDGSQNSVIYTAGRPDEINRYGFNPTNVGVYFYAEYPLDGGDINMQAGRDILGKPTGQLVSEWLVRTGNWSTKTTHFDELPTAWGIAFGSINREASGLGTNSPDFSQQQSLAALGGGNVTISAKGNINDVSVVIPTTGKQIGTNNFGESFGLDYLDNKVDVNGGGNLQVKAGGDISGGVFHVDGESVDGSRTTGTANLYAGGSFKAGTNQGLNPILALGDSQYTVTAGKEVALEAIIDPMLIKQNQADTHNQFFRYSADSAVRLTALSGDITLKNDFEALARASKNTNMDISGDLETVRALPATVKAYALNGDIKINDILNLYPSAKGQLELFAANNITGDATVNLSDADPNLLPSSQLPVSTVGGRSDDALDRLSSLGVTNFIHKSTPVHLGDKEPVLISTGSGNISGLDEEHGLEFVLAKPVEVNAGKDIVNASFQIQHNASNIANSIVQAERDIKFGLPINKLTGKINPIIQGIEISGPGQLSVLAGRNIDLGSSDGITSIGNTGNTVLADEGANISVIAGLAGGHLNVNGFAEKFLANTDKYAAEYTRYIEQFIVATGDATGRSDLTPETAKAEFNALSPSDKARIEKSLLSFVQQVYFKELKLAGSKGASAPTKQVQDQAELELLAAIETLLPGTTLLAGNNDYTVDPFKGVVANDTTSAGAILKKVNASANSNRSQLGSISLPFSTIQTVDGGDVNLMAPNGGLTAGLPTSIVISGKTVKDQAGNEVNDPGKLGIIAKKKGDINVAVRDDLNVNTGRTSTLGGGNVLGVSTEQDVDAGRTPKSQVSAPVTTVSYDKDGFPVIEVSPPLKGGGISANSPPGIPDGNIDIYAFRGIIDAAEAGIAGKNVTVFGTAILGASNISVGGVGVGVPVAPTGSIAAGLTGVSNVAASVTNAVDSATNIGEDTNKALANAVQGILSVDFLGFGE